MRKLLFLGLCCIISLSSLFAHNRIHRVEPTNWWVGMNNPSLQLTIYGHDIAKLQPVINYPGVSIERVIKVNSPNYLFVYLQLAADTKAGTFDILFQDSRGTATKHSYTLSEREDGAAETEGFDGSDVLYLITPDRFANGIPANDNVPGMKEKANRSFEGGRHGGDIKGIIDHLDYIADMGFTAIWVNPVLENDMPEYSYHGYATTDFYKVDQRFGSNEEYLKLSRLAKEKGIKIIMDMIVNHSGSEHWFVKDPPTKDWINFDLQFSPTSHRRQANQDIHASEYDKKQFSDGWFVETMPDLNQRNDLMADYLIQNTIWWIEYLKLGGIRMDTYPYPDKDFMTRWTCEVLAEYPNFNMVGEEWIAQPAIVSYWQQDKHNSDGYTSCLPSLMDFPIQFAAAKALVEEEKKYGSGLIGMYDMLALDFLYPHPEDLVIFPDNHDMDRFFTQVNEDVDLHNMGMVYFTTIRGVPQIYYGTEILMTNKGYPGNHGIIRSDFPGGWAQDSVNAFTGVGLSEDQLGAQQYLKKLLNWRKGKKVIHEGRLMQFAPHDGFYVYFRYMEGEKVMVILNKNEDAKKLKLARYVEMLGDVKKGIDPLEGKEYVLGAELAVPAKSALILELK